MKRYEAGSGEYGLDEMIVARMRKLFVEKTRHLRGGGGVGLRCDGRGLN